MPERMSEELGKSITHTNFFFFTIGDDAYIVLDFNDPDDTLIDQMLKECEGARHTFVLTTSVLPMTEEVADGSSTGKSAEETAARRHFRKVFAQRNALCICGHIHTTELADWHGMVAALHNDGQ